MEATVALISDKFEDVCKRLETSEHGLLKVCKTVGVSYDTFLSEVKSNPNAEIRYARAKEQQVETLLEQISDLQEQCLNEIRNIEDPKRCNAIQSAYREQIRHIEWIASKLKAIKYGDKIDITTDNESINRSIEIAPVPLTKGSVDKT